MNLDGVRNAKAEVFRYAFGFVETAVVRESTGLPGFGLPDRSLGFESRTEDLVFRGTGPDVPPWLTAEVFERGGLSEDIARIDVTSVARFPEPPRIALGIVPGGRHRDEFRLVLFGEHANLRDHPVVAHAIQLSNGEADFVHSGPVRALSFWQPPRLRPVRIGMSVAHHRVSAGTLGAYVRHAGDRIAMLSNNHVFANVNDAVLGDPILQPGKRDGGIGPGDIVGFLARFVTIDSSPGATNIVDCALADLADGILPCAACAALDGEVARQLKGSSTAELTGDEVLYKSGRTTGPTHGRVYAVEVDNYMVNMGTASKPVHCRFDDQIQVFSDERDFARRGDSGAVVFDQEGLARGLLFSGSPKGAPSGHGLAAMNPIEPVLRLLDAQIWIG